MSALPAHLALNPAANGCEQPTVAGIAAGNPHQADAERFLAGRSTAESSGGLSCVRGLAKAAGAKIGREWVPATVAAEMMGVHVGNLTRRCRRELEARGLAMFTAPPQGGQAQWFVHVAADPRLSSGGIGELYQMPDLSKCSRKQQTTALQRAVCADALGHALATRPGKVGDWLPALIAELQQRFPDLRIKRSSLYAWHNAYARPADLEKLIDDRGGDRRSQGDPAAWAKFKDFFLDPRQPSVKQCWEAVREMAQEQGWTWCTLASCHNQLNTKIAPEQQLHYREPEKWKQQMQPTIEQDPDGWRAGECWTADHHVMNLWVRSGNQVLRPWITAIMDNRTRRVVGWVMADSPNTWTIIQAMKKALKDPANMGGPDVFWLDNGKDFASYSLNGETKAMRRERVRLRMDEPDTAGVFKLLSIEVHFAIKYNPNGKARLERWFGTLEPFYRTFATYTGNEPDTRPENLGKILADWNGIPTFEEVERRLGAHIRGDNASREHQIDALVIEGERLSSDEAMARLCDRRKVMVDPDSLDLILKNWYPKPVSVTRRGIGIRLNGRTFRYGQFTPELSRFKALSKHDRPKLRVSFDSDDVSSITVHDEQYRLICQAPMNNLGGLHGGDLASAEKLKRVCREKGAYRKALKHTAELSITSVLTAEERLAELASERPAPQPQPAALKPVRTPLDGQSKPLQRERVRKAVGAENMSPPEASMWDLLTESRRIDQSQRTAAAVGNERAEDPWSSFREASDE